MISKINNSAYNPSFGLGYETKRNKLNEQSNCYLEDAANYLKSEKVNPSDVFTRTIKFENGDLARLNVKPSNINKGDMYTLSYFSPKYDYEPYSVDFFDNSNMVCYTDTDNTVNLFNKTMKEAIDDCNKFIAGLMPHFLEEKSGHEYDYSALTQER